MHISPTENTTNFPRKGEYPDSLMLPAPTEIRAQKYSPFEVRARLCARVLELTKLSMSYQQIQTEIFESTHIRLSKGSIKREQEEMDSPRLQYFFAWLPKWRMATTEESY